MPDNTTEIDSDDANTASDHDRVTREVRVGAPLEEVWEAVSTDAGRERWLEPDADRTLIIEETDAPNQISWWWWHESDDDPARHVAIELSPIPDGTRVTVTETLPAFQPLAQLAAAFEVVRA